LYSLLKGENMSLIQLTGLRTSAPFVKNGYSRKRTGLSGAARKNLAIAILIATCLLVILTAFSSAKTSSTASASTPKKTRTQTTSRQNLSRPMPRHATQSTPTAPTQSFSSVPAPIDQPEFMPTLYEGAKQGGLPSNDGPLKLILVKVDYLVDAPNDPTKARCHFVVHNISGNRIHIVGCKKECESRRFPDSSSGFGDLNSIDSQNTVQVIRTVDAEQKDGRLTFTVTYQTKDGLKTVVETFDPHKQVATR